VKYVFHEVLIFGLVDGPFIRSSKTIMKACLLIFAFLLSMCIWLYHDLQVFKGQWSALGPDALTPPFVAKQHRDMMRHRHATTSPDANRRTNPEQKKLLELFKDTEAIKNWKNREGLLNFSEAHPD
jgi:hypothetical protein